MKTATHLIPDHVRREIVTALMILDAPETEGADVRASALKTVLDFTASLMRVGRDKTKTARRVERVGCMS